MKDARNPTRWQVAGIALAATVIAAGLAFATPVPRLAADGEPGGVVRTVEESPGERARLAQLVRRAEAITDRDGHERSTGDGGELHHESDTAEPTDDEPTPTEHAPSEEDAPVEQEPLLEEDPPTLDGGGDGDEDGGSDSDGD